MTSLALIQLAVFVTVLIVLAVPIGNWMARVFESKTSSFIEKPLYRLAGIDPSVDMKWTTYAGAVLLFNILGVLIVFLIQRLQAVLPLNPVALPAVPAGIAFNTAVSFATNTNWQAYGGETTMSYLTQMLALTVQNFVSAGTGIAVLVALVRGFTRVSTPGIGNFWVDLTRATLHILLPLSIVFALVLVSQGVVQTFETSATAQLIDPQGEVTTQTIAVGPVASQIAIKQLGTNGGGFFNVNSAHPFENPTPFTNFLELLAILVLPAAMCITLGRLLKDARQGWVLLAAMFAIFIPVAIVTMWAEQHGTPLLHGENLEGKELRFGTIGSALWAVATTAASNGSVNAMHDSFTPLGGLGPMWLMQLGEVVFGGVGSGLYGMLLFAILAVFIAGLMVGRTPEYLGKKIEASEMKMAVLGVLLPAASVLVGTALACLVPEGTASIANPGAHGFSEMLYAFSSGANNNGSAFGGLTVNGPFYAFAIGVVMLIGRYWVIIPVLGIAGRLASKKSIPVTSGTLPTHTPLFAILLVGTVVLVGALTFIPALALGPIIEHLQMGALP